MPICNRIVAGVMLCVSSIAVAQSADQLAAQRVLGPHWRQVARAAGLIFTGTVVSVRSHAPSQASPVATVEAKFLVDRGIAGAHSGQVVTIREWAAVWPMQRPMRRDGSLALFFFYPPSAAGLTSPVGGPVGQVPLDAKGNVRDGWGVAPANDPTRLLRPPQRTAVPLPQIRLSQLERAIRAAREEKE